MAVDLNENVEQFYLSLLDLKSNSKPMIAMLTELAEENKEWDRGLVKVIGDAIYEMPADRKLPYLYLIDSICKHVGLEYITLFSECLVSLFHHVYTSSSSEVKRSMIKLRKTWCKLFPDYLLSDLDNLMLKTDSDWPFGYRMRTRSTSETTKIPGDEPSILSRLLNDNRSESELQSIQPLFETNQHLLPAKSSYSSASTAFPAHSLQKHPVATHSVPTHSVPTHSQPTQSAPPVNESSMSCIPVNSGFPHNQQATRSVSALDLLSAHSNQHSNQPPNQFPNQLPNQYHPNQQLALTPAPANQLVAVNQFQAVTGPPMVAFSSPPCAPAIQPALNSNASFINNHIYINNQLVPYSNPNRSAVTGGHSLPAFHPAFDPAISSPALNHAPNRSNNLAVRPIGNFPNPNFNPNLNVNKNINHNLCRVETSTRNTSCLISCQSPRDFRPVVNHGQFSPITVPYKQHRENDNKVIPDNFNRKRPLDSSTVSPAKRKRNPLGWLNKPSSGQPPRNSNCRPGARGPVSSNRLNPVIVKPNTGESSSIKTNKVTTVDESMIMFESNYYKIYHLDETTSIMLLRCPLNLKFNELKHCDPMQIDPRKVYFDGGPVDVHIDEHDIIRLAFGEQWKKFRASNGFEQYIKFGTPDREVFLNDQIIKARFGGPSLACRLNGDEQMHSIRLGLPAPSVRVSNETRVDLWYQLIKKVHVLESSNAAPSNRMNFTPKPLKFTKKVDCRSPDSTRSDREEDDPKPKSKSKSKEKKNRDELPLLELETDSLRIKRPQLIKQLYSGLQCTSCSLRFNVQTKENKEKYSKHLDWHFRKNRKNRNKAHNGSQALKRDWYYPLDQWLQFKEITLESNSSKPERQPDIRPAAAAAAAAVAGTSQQSNKQPNDRSRIKANLDDSLNVCSTCYEKFEEIWCDEEEDWLLENATIINGHYYHPTCLVDEPVQVSTSDSNEATGLDLNNNEIGDKIEMSTCDLNGENSTTSDPNNESSSSGGSKVPVSTSDLDDEKSTADTNSQTSSEVPLSVGALLHAEKPTPSDSNTEANRKAQQVSTSNLNDESATGLRDANNNEIIRKAAEEEKREADAPDSTEILSDLTIVHSFDSNPVSDEQNKKLLLLVNHDHDYFMFPHDQLPSESITKSPPAEPPTRSTTELPIESPTKQIVELPTKSIANSKVEPPTESPTPQVGRFKKDSESTESAFCCIM